MVSDTVTALTIYALVASLLGVAAYRFGWDDRRR